VTLKEYKPGTAFSGVIGRTFDVSSPAWPEPLRAREGAPNVLFIVQGPCRLRGALFVAEWGLVRRDSRRPVRSPWRPRLMPCSGEAWVGRSMSMGGKTLVILLVLAGSAPGYPDATYLGE
jgi:hypothetical protein